MCQGGALTRSVAMGEVLPLAPCPLTYVLPLAAHSSPTQGRPVSAPHSRSPARLHTSVNRLLASREAGRERLRQLEEVSCRSLQLQAPFLKLSASCQRPSCFQMCDSNQPTVKRAGLFFKAANASRIGICAQPFLLPALCFTRPLPQAGGPGAAAAVTGGTAARDGGDRRQRPHSPALPRPRPPRQSRRRRSARGTRRHAHVPRGRDRQQYQRRGLCESCGGGDGAGGGGGVQAAEQVGVAVGA